MNYFEKIFLSTILLFGIVIVFFLGLYFDLGDMFSSSIGKGGFVTRGTAIDRLVDSLDRTRRSTKAIISDGNAAFGHVSRSRGNFPGTRADISMRYQKYFGRYFKKGNERVAQYKAYLIRQGFKNREFIEMKSFAQDMTIVRKYLPIARKLSAIGEFGEAVSTLEGALGELPEGDYEQREQIASKIVQLCLQGGFLEKAQKYTDLQVELKFKILKIESNSKLMEIKSYSSEVNAALQTVERKRSQVDAAFASMKKRQQETGKYDGLFTEEKIAIKAEVLGLKSKGEISNELYTEMLSSIE